jgi:hypothetical protein
MGGQLPALNSINPLQSAQDHRITRLFSSFRDAFFPQESGVNIPFIPHYIITVIFLGISGNGKFMVSLYHLSPNGDDFLGRGEPMDLDGFLWVTQYHEHINIYKPSINHHSSACF